MSLKIENVKLDAIKPYGRNAKRHPAEQIEQIKKSIQEFGFRDPIGVWKGEIVEGHGRYIAAKELGLETVPIIRLDDLTDEQRRAYALVHNKLTMNSGFDVGMLQVELDNIDLDMGDFGFTDSFSFFEPVRQETVESEQEPDKGAILQNEQIQQVSKEELQKYSEEADDFLIRKRIIITYLPDDEEKVKAMLNIKGENVKVVYSFEELAK